jgi:AhpD family alkylhydroperoxidase
MTDLEGIARTRKWAHARFHELGSRVFEAFLRMEEAAFADGALSRKAKELVAVGIAVAQGCASCIQWHVESAARAGASRQEVLEAVEVAMEMGGGQATVSARIALEVMDHVFDDAL